MTTTLLRIYVNDHRAGAAGGLALAQRSAAGNRGTALGDELEQLAADLARDAATLDEIARHLHVAANPFKQWSARLGELVGRAKLNGRLTEYSPLSRLLELELLAAGIDAKRSLWRSLQAAAVPVPPGVDLDDLIARATDQRARLLPFHDNSAPAALDPAPTTA